ncbi:MAG: methyltransferase domain-containing protein [Phycisphaerales bacterium]|nr:methyltransferase domain-containing protein [Phycisphaerales bacterium]
MNVTLTLLSLILATSAPTGQDAPVQEAITAEVDVTSLTSGAGAPRTSLVVEAIRIQARTVDPDARVRLKEIGTLELEADELGWVHVTKVIEAMGKTEPSERITPESLYVDRRETRDGIGRHFFGREIARVMGHLGASWLERPSREKEERTSLLIEMLGVENDTDVADIGAGTGYFTFPIARKAVDGTVHAVDIQPEMLEFIEARKRTEGVDNVKGVLGTITDTKLEPESIDLAFAVDAYHEFSNPVEMLLSIRKALRPGGHLVLVEFRLEDPEVPIKKLHKMSEAQAKKELEAMGFDWVRTDDKLPRQHVLVFRKPAAPEPE